MALDVHKLENGKTGELLFQINDSIYAVLELSFDLFRRRTGLFIDPYGDLKLEFGLGELIHAVTDCAGEVQPKNQVVYNEFLTLFKNVELNKMDVIFIGD